MYVLHQGGSCNEDTRNRLLNDNWTNRPAYDWYKSYIAGQQPPTTYSVSFRAANDLYVCAEENGGNVVNAKRPWTYEWETFDLIDSNHGSLQSGDAVYIRTSANWYFEANGNGYLSTAGTSETQWTAFTIIRVNGSGAIGNGNAVALRAWDGGHWVAELEQPPDYPVNANRPSIGSWETFTLIIH